MRIWQQIRTSFAAIANWISKFDPTDLALIITSPRIHTYTLYRHYYSAPNAKNQIDDDNSIFNCQTYLSNRNDTATMIITTPIS